jgi:BirA family biotin operon repressor/biotin-[acetyl-CoA-carboxylase] ligase
VAGPQIVVFDELDSTNAEARRRAEAGDFGPYWIMAKRQTAGRGRRGRVWSTGEGNLAATLLIKLDRSAAEAAQIAFVAALAVADLGETLAGPGSVRLKWPNDLLLFGEKAAGILVESGALPGHGVWLAVGVGMNLAQAPSGLDYRATAFAAHTDKRVAPRDALEILSASFQWWLSIWEKQGFAPISQAWTARAHGIGDRCEARLPGSTICGVAEGLDTDGALRLRLDGGAIERITAGDVFFGGA